MIMNKDLHGEYAGDLSPPLPQVYNTSDFLLPFNKEVFRKLMTAIEKEEEIGFHLLEVVYVDEAEITKLNREYLSGDYVTDIITFRYDEDDSLQSIEGTLFCCAPRISEQADEFRTTCALEFYRVFIHGLLHLAGYNDQTKKEKENMTRLENHYLSEIH